MAGLKRKIFFWIILGALSTLFAEVIAGSMAFPFTTLPGLVIVFPLYFLHTIFFFYIIYHYGKPTLPVIFGAGMLFGMYEAYMTKVIWISYVGTGPLFSFGGIALLETLLLVLFWHSILAFSLPVILGETYLTKSRESLGLLPKKIQKSGSLLLILIILWGGLFTSINSPAIEYSFLSTLVGGVMVLALVYLWKKTGGGEHNMRELLPTRNQFGGIAFLLLLLYIIYFFAFNFDRLPGLAAQATVWAMYIVLIWMLIRNLKKSQKAKALKIRAEFSWKHALGLLALFAASAVVGEVLHLEAPLILGSFLLIIPGAILLLITLKSALRA